MSHRFDPFLEPRPVREDPARLRRLDIVFTPVDGFTGQIVAGINAKIERQSLKARRSLSGHLVFEALWPEDAHLVRFDAGQSGYFTPPERNIPMPQVRVEPQAVFATAAEKQAALDADTRILRLALLPEAVTDGEAMIIRGGVIRDGAPAEGVEVTGLVEDNPETFVTQTNARGVFAIRLRPAREPLNADAVETPRRARVRLRFDGGDKWRSEDHVSGDGRLRDLHTHRIPEPIDIS